MKEKKTKKKQNEEQDSKSSIVEKSSDLAIEKCKDKDCPFHGRLRVRGRTFEGKITKKFSRRVVIEFERIIYIKKYERYAKSKTKIHARLPFCMENQVNIGDLILIQECKPLSKIIHFAVIKKIKDKDVFALKSNGDLK